MALSGESLRAIVFLFLMLILFAGDDCFAGAYFSARAAIDASIGVDVIDIAFRDSLYGANGKTGTASYTRISNYVSHSFEIFKYYTNKV